MNNPEAPDRFSVILGDVSHNVWLPSQKLPQRSPDHSAVARCLQVIGHPLQTGHCSGIVGKGRTWMVYGSCPPKDECLARKVFLIIEVHPVSEGATWCILFLPAQITDMEKEEVRALGGLLVGEPRSFHTDHKRDDPGLDLETEPT